MKKIINIVIFFLYTISCSSLDSKLNMYRVTPTNSNDSRGLYFSNTQNIQYAYPMGQYHVEELRASQQYSSNPYELDKKYKYEKIRPRSNANSNMQNSHQNYENIMHQMPSEFLNPKTGKTITDDDIKNITGNYLYACKQQLLKILVEIIYSLYNNLYGVCEYYKAQYKDKDENQKYFSDEDAKALLLYAGENFGNIKTKIFAENNNCMGEGCNKALKDCSEGFILCKIQKDPKLLCSNCFEQLKKKVDSKKNLNGCINFKIFPNLFINTNELKENVENIEILEQILIAVNFHKSYLESEINPLLSELNEKRGEITSDPNSTIKGVFSNAFHIKTAEDKTKRLTQTLKENKDLITYLTKVPIQHLETDFCGSPLLICEDKEISSEFVKSRSRAYSEAPTVKSNSSIKKKEEPIEKIFYKINHIVLATQRLLFLQHILDKMIGIDKNNENKKNEYFSHRGIIQGFLLLNYDNIIKLKSFIDEIKNEKEKLIYLKKLMFAFGLFSENIDENKFNELIQNSELVNNNETYNKININYNLFSPAEFLLINEFCSLINVWGLETKAFSSAVSLETCRQLIVNLVKHCGNSTNYDRLNEIPNNNSNSFVNYCKSPYPYLESQKIEGSHFNNPYCKEESQVSFNDSKGYLTDPKIGKPAIIESQVKEFPRSGTIEKKPSFSQRRSQSKISHHSSQPNTKRPTLSNSNALSLVEKLSNMSQSLAQSTVSQKK